jgi:hypothetical protein
VVGMLPGVAHHGCGHTLVKAPQEPAAIRPHGEVR